MTSMFHDVICRLFFKNTRYTYVETCNTCLFHGPLLILRYIYREYRFTIYLHRTICFQLQIGIP